MVAIERFRLKFHLTQKDLANKLQVTQGTVSQWEQGTAAPRTDKLPELAKIFNCSIDDLFDTETG